MTCSDVREAMLEAESDALAGAGDSPLAMHLQMCESCRAVAADVLAATNSARIAYRAIAPRRVPVVIRGRNVARRAMWAVVSLAAAAAIALTVMSPRRSTGVPDGAWFVDLPDPPSTEMSVVVPDDRNAIVFETKNPQVSVVWIY